MRTEARPKFFPGSPASSTSPCIVTLQHTACTHCAHLTSDKTGRCALRTLRIQAAWSSLPGARPNQAWRSSCVSSYNLSRSARPSSSCTRFHLNRSIFSNSTNLSFNSSDSSFASITEKNLAPAVLLSSTVNPIIQSTSHPTASARFWSQLCPSKVPRDRSRSVGPAA